MVPHLTTALTGPLLELERQFLDNDFSLRMGSWDGTLTMGFGLRFFDDFKMDYAYQNGSIVKEHHVSVRVPF